VASVDPQIWLFGGRKSISDGEAGTFFTADIWSSANLGQWALENAAAPWGPRGDFAVALFPWGQVFLFGGEGQANAQAPPQYFNGAAPRPHCTGRLS
jgi:hypothetical protein